MTSLEKSIISRMVAHLAAHGWTCALGTAEHVCNVVDDYGDIRVRFNGREGEGVSAWVRLIEGNGCDIISDWGAHTDHALDVFSRDFDPFVDELNDEINAGTIHA